MLKSTISYRGLPTYTQSTQMRTKIFQNKKLAQHQLSATYRLLDSLSFNTALS